MQEKKLPTLTVSFRALYSTKKNPYLTNPSFNPYPSKSLFFFVVLEGGKKQRGTRDGCPAGS
jgi:hypothetical protein